MDQPGLSMSAANRRIVALVAVVLTAALTLFLRRAARRPAALSHATAASAAKSETPDAMPAQHEPDALAHIAIDVELWKLPGALPGLGPVAPPLRAADLEPRIAGVVRRGQVTQTDALHAARAVWPALAQCGVDRQRSVMMTFSLSGGQAVGSSAVHGARIDRGLTEAERACAVAGLAHVQAPVATDCQGEVEVHFGSEPRAEMPLKAAQ